MGTTLAQLRTRARRRADMEGSSFVGTAEWTDLLNAARRALFDTLMEADEDYVVTLSTPSGVTKDASGCYMALPSTLYKLRSFERQIASGTPPEFIDVPRITWSERNTGRIGYVVLGSNIHVFPASAVSTTDLYRIGYIAFPTDLASEADEITAYETQWDDFIIVRAAIWALEKEESDPSALTRELDAIEKRVSRAADNRDIDQPGGIIDVRGGMALDWEGVIPRLPR